MLPAEDLFVHVYVMVDDAIACGAIAIAPRPGPTPGCSDAEILAMTMVRPLGRRTRPGSWPRWPATGHACSRWCRTRASSAGGPAGCGAHSSCSGRRWRQTCPTMTASKSIPPRCRSSTPSRVRGPDSWTGPGGPVARFGRDGAHAEWFYGFRLAVKTDLGSRIVRAWGIVPAAVNEGDVAEDLPEAGPPLP